MMEEEFEFCMNCKRGVSAKNYVIHKVHCERKIQLCKRCAEPIPCSELEKHEEEFHVWDTCSDCKIRVERWQMEKHKDSCVKQLVPCEYCELEVFLDSLSEHSAACGSRTEQCPKCEKYVMIKDLEKHRVNCLQRILKTSEHCPVFQLSIPLSEMNVHTAYCAEIRYETRVDKHEVQINEDFAKKVDFKALTLDSAEKIKPERYLEKNVELCSSCDCKIPEERYHKHILLCFNGNKECHFCGMEIPKENYLLHFGKCNKILEMVKEDGNSQNQNNKPAESMSKHPQNSEKMKYVEICPSCNCKILEERYHGHLQLCYNGMSLCHFCGLEIPKNNDHFRQCYKILEMVKKNKKI